MSFLPRRRRDYPEPLLNRQRVARFIDRDPGRVSRYVQAGQMPDPDGVLDDGSPLWQESTIRTWWLDRGEALPAAAAGTRRYHQHWENLRQPALLEERILHLRLARGLTTHVRVYDGMDGRGPVVILGIMGSIYAEDLAAQEAAALRHELSRELLSDVDLQPTVWVAVHCEYASNQDYEAGAAPRVYVHDLADPALRIPATDIARLIGRPFDVYPDIHYTERNVATRQATGEQDTPPGTEVVVDKAELGRWVTYLRTVAAAVAERPELRFAAGLLAGRCLNAHNSAVAQLEFSGYGDRGQSEPIPGTITAVYVTQRHLAPIEMRLCKTYALTEPLETLDRDSNPPWVVREDAVAELAALRRMLWDVTLAEEAPLREALTKAEELLASAIHRALPEFARHDLGFSQTRFSAESPETQAWLGQLRPVSDGELATIDEGRLQRSARLLLASQPEWVDTQLWYDVAADTVALTGVEQSSYTPETARDRITRPLWHQQDRSPSQIEADIATLLRDRRLVAVWWPLSPNPHLRNGTHVVAPSLGFDHPVRPVYVLDRSGRRHLLPAESVRRYHGFVWGVSSTDTIAPVIYDLVADAPLYPAWGDAEDTTSSFDQRRDALGWLADQLGTAQPLELDLGEVRVEFRGRGLFAS